jgi:hypothetical protein
MSLIYHHVRLLITLQVDISRRQPSIRCHINSFGPVFAAFTGYSSRYKRDEKAFLNASPNVSYSITVLFGDKFGFLAKASELLKTIDIVLFLKLRIEHCPLAPVFSHFDQVLS